MRPLLLTLSLLLASGLAAATLLVEAPQSVWAAHPDLDVRYTNGLVVIAIVDDADLADLPGARLLDDQGDASFWLVSHISGRLPRLDAGWGRLAWSNGATAILRTDNLPEDEILAAGMMVTPLPTHTLQRPKTRHLPELTSTRNEVDDLVAEVNADSLEWVIQQLQDFGTRYAPHENRLEVAQWIQNRFISLGYEDTVLDSFQWSGTTQYNVIATLPGTVSPDTYILIGGHHDSTNNSGDPWTSAPGADDNGSGAAAAMEMARVIAATGWQPAVSIRFCTFAAEEVGLKGAYHMSAMYAQEDLDILMMLNNDMIAYSTSSPDDWQIDVCTYTGFEMFGDLSEQLMPQYTTLQPGSDPWLNCGSTDSYPFWLQGFPCIFYIETEFTPNYHTSLDILDNANIPFAAEVMKLSAAMVGTMAGLPPEVENFTVRDEGDGDRLYLAWDPVTDPNFDHYLVQVGLESGVYTDSYPMTSDQVTLSDLTEGTTYYIGVSVINSSDVQGVIVEETGTPRVIPRAPADFTVTPELDQTRLDWTPNTEGDHEGYLVFRGDTMGQLDQIADIGQVDYYVDDEVENGQFYWYAIEAYDMDDNTSSPTAVLRGRAVTMDQGVLVVNDTRGGDGSFLHPTQEEAGAYWESVLPDVAYQTYYVDSLGEVRLDELAAYSTVIWRIDDASFNSQAMNWTPALAQWLDYGGNLLVAGFEPTNAFANATSSPESFFPGDFVYDYLGIAQRSITNTARFNHAIASDRFGDIHVNTDLIAPNLDGHLLFIERIQASEGASEIYTYGSGYTTAEPYGCMNGVPVGVARWGQDFNAVTLSFPLYYMQADDTRAFLEELLIDHFDELDVNDQSPPAPRLALANHPNPFNPETTVRFTLPSDSDVTLAVYNIRGQRVATLVDGPKKAGQHNIVWRADGQASGVYLLRLTSGDTTCTHKTLLLK